MNSAKLTIDRNTTKNNDNTTEVWLHNAQQLKNTIKIMYG